jgi:hypothetical protein
MKEEAEYVDPHLLLRYREYAWSREHNRWGAEAWDALRGEIARDGFHEAAILAYNHVTGQGYLVEGNHRVGIALELGIPVPLVVYRSPKTAPDYPMRPVTPPGKYSMRDAYGFSQFREFMKPSDIGLPTVERQRGEVIASEAEAPASTAMTEKATSIDSDVGARDEGGQSAGHSDVRATERSESREGDGLEP